jgi:probable rRNA maturation factor
VPEAAALCRRAARATLAGAASAGVGRIDFNVAFAVVLADDALVRELNRRFRGKDEPTNVLSFPGDDVATPTGTPGTARELGDVVLAYETIAREADEQSKPLVDHLAHLVVHGVLHLLGFDHETDREAARMEGLEIGILAGLGIADPYRAAAA